MAFRLLFLALYFLGYFQIKIIAFVVDVDLLGPTFTESSRALTLFALFPTGGKLFYRQELMRPTLEFALECVKKYIPSKYPLDMEWIGTNELTNCQGVDTTLVWKTIEEVSILHAQGKNEHIAYFGPGCVKGAKDMATWLRKKEKPLFDAFVSASSLRDEDNFPTLIRTGYTDTKLYQMYAFVTEELGLHNITVIGEDSDGVWNSIMSSLKLLKQHRNITMNFVPISNDYNETLENIKYESTAIFFLGHVKCVKEILIKAVRMNLTEHPNPMTFVITHFFDADYWGSMEHEANMTSEELADLKKAYNRTLVLRYFDNYVEDGVNALKQSVLEYIDDHSTKYNQSYVDAIHNNGINPTVLGYYSAVHVYGLTLKALIDSCTSRPDSDSCSNMLKTIRNGTIIAEKIREIGKFAIPFLGNIEFNGNNDLNGSFVLQLYNETSCNFTNWIITTAESPEKLYNYSLFYVAKEPLQDEGSDVIPDDTDSIRDETIALISLSLLLVLFIVSGIVTRYYVRNMKLVNSWWKILPQELIYLKHNRLPQKSHDSLTIATGFSSIDISKAEDLELAHYRDQVVVVHRIEQQPGFREEDLLKELRDIRAHNHPNLLRLYGLCIESETVLVVTEYCSRGSLAELLVKQQLELDWSFRYSLIHDLFEAISYIQTVFGHHGRLTSLVCMVDRTFVLKVTDHAPKCIQQARCDMDALDQLWTAPEVLRNEDKKKNLTKLDYAKADIYSIGIILQEIAMESHPYCGPDGLALIAAPDEIIHRVAAGEDPPFRPDVSPESCHMEYRLAMESCWQERPNARPTISTLKSQLRKFRGTMKGNILDDLLQRLQTYADQLQSLVEERTLQLREEQQKIQSLLYELLPKSVADKLISRNPVEPEPFDCVTVYFSDIVSFTTISAESTPHEVVNMLNQLYSLFDSIIDNFDAYKVETIGDAYMVVSGLPKRNGCLHATIISRLALRILKAVENFQIPHRPDDKLALRIGIHSGPCVAGIVGNKMPRYCLFGDTINTASRMESTSEANRIQLSSSTYENIKNNPEFILESRGLINIKGKGTMETYWLTSSQEILLDPVPEQPIPFSQSISYIGSTIGRRTLRKRKSVEPFPSSLYLNMDDGTQSNIILQNFTQF